MPKGIYERKPRTPREYPTGIVEMVRSLYCDQGMTIREVQDALPKGYKAQRIIERHISERRPAIKRDQRAERNTSWKGHAVSYDGMHERVKAQRGPARSLPCVDCGNPAHDWSYRGGCPLEQIAPDTGCAFTTDISFYDPRCRSCHRQHDAAARRAKEVMSYV